MRGHYQGDNNAYDGIPYDKKLVIPSGKRTAILYTIRVQYGESRRAMEELIPPLRDTNQG